MIPLCIFRRYTINNSRTRVLLTVSDHALAHFPKSEAHPAKEEPHIVTTKDTSTMECLWSCDGLVLELMCRHYGRPAPGKLQVLMNVQVVVLSTSSPHTSTCC